MLHPCGDVTGGDPALVRFSVDIAQLVPRRSYLDRQAYGGTGVSVPRAMQSRLRRNAQSEVSLSWMVAFQHEIPESP
jgi:hypothetical protein